MFHSGDVDVLRIDDIWNLLLPQRLIVQEPGNLQWEATLMQPTYTEERFTARDIWNLVQEPIPVYSAHPEQHYLLMRGALDVGWSIEEPVYLRSCWGEGDALIYHFILRRTTQEPPRLISVPQDAEVDHFLQDHHLKVERD